MNICWITYKNIFGWLKFMIFCFFYLQNTLMVQRSWSVICDSLIKCILTDYIVNLSFLKDYYFSGSSKNI